MSNIKDIIWSLDNRAEDWVMGSYEYTNKNSPDLNIWVSSGVFFIKISGFDGFSLWEKFAINRAIKRSIGKKLRSTL